LPTSSDYDSTRKGWGEISPEVTFIKKHKRFLQIVFWRKSLATGFLVSIMHELTYNSWQSWVHGVFVKRNSRFVVKGLLLKEQQKFVKIDPRMRSIRNVGI